MSAFVCSMIPSKGFSISSNYVGVEVNGLTLEDVMNRALTFDFNKYKKEGDQTFELRFMEGIVNELGYMMKPAAIEVIILQFRKFMAVMAYNLMIERENQIDTLKFANCKTLGIKFGN